MNFSTRLNKLSDRCNETRVEGDILRESYHNIFTMIKNMITFLESKQSSSSEFYEIYMDIISICDKSYHEIINMNFTLSKIQNECEQINNKHKISLAKKEDEKIALVETCGQILINDSEVKSIELVSENINSDILKKETENATTVDNKCADLAKNSIDEINQAIHFNKTINIDKENTNESEVSDYKLDTIEELSESNSSKKSTHLKSNILNKPPENASAVYCNTLKDAIEKSSKSIQNYKLNDFNSNTQKNHIFNDLKIDKTETAIVDMSTNENIPHSNTAQSSIKVQNISTPNKNPIVNETHNKISNQMHFNEKVLRYFLSENKKKNFHHINKRNRLPHHRAVKEGSPPFQKPTLSLNSLPNIVSNDKTKQECSGKKEDMRNSLDLILKKIKKPQDVQNLKKNTEASTADTPETVTSGDESTKTLSEMIHSIETKRCASTVKKGDQCIVARVYSPSNFSIVVANQYTQHYDSFHKDLEEYAESTNAMKFSNKEELRHHNNTIVCCYHQNEEYPWSRCEIIDWLDNNENYVFIYAIDDGLKDEVKISNIRGLSSQFIEYPRMAQQCRLAYLYPSGSTFSKRLDYWSHESVSAFKRMVYSNGCYTQFIINEVLCNDCNIMGVDLCNSNGTSVGAALVIQNHAEVIPPIETLADMKESFVEKESNLNNAIDLSDCESNSKQAIDNVFGGYSGKDYSRFCKFTKVPGEYCFKGKRCKLEHDFIDPDGYTKDKEIMCHKINEFEIPPLNSVVILRPTAIINDSQFYCQIIEPKRTYLFCSENLSFYKFHKKLSEPGNVKKYKKLYILPAIHQLVLCKSSTDNLWYRGRVLDISSEEKILVQLIDFGDYEHIPLQNLRKIEEDDLVIPEQAIECKIPENSSTIKLDFNDLCENILDKKIICKIRSSTIPLLIEIEKILK